MITNEDDGEILLRNKYMELNRDTNAFIKIQGFFSYILDEFLGEKLDKETLLEIKQDCETIIGIFKEYDIEPYVIVMGIYNYFRVYINLNEKEDLFLEDPFALALCLQTAAKFCLDRHQKNKVIFEEIQLTIEAYSEESLCLFNKIERAILKELDYKFHIRYDDIKPLIDRILGVQIIG
jgi:hypothetical protein